MRRQVCCNDAGRGRPFFFEQWSKKNLKFNTKHILKWLCPPPPKKKINYKKKRKSNIISIWLKGVFFSFSCLNIFWIFKYCPSTFKNDARCPGNILRLLLKCFIAQTKRNNSYIYLVKNLPCIQSIFRFWKNRFFKKNIILYIVFTKNHEVNKVLYV